MRIDETTLAELTPSHDNRHSVVRIAKLSRCRKWRGIPLSENLLYTLPLARVYRFVLISLPLRSSKNKLIVVSRRVLARQ
ncbi:hypothetical protein [Microbulbifer hainanensis]|uniref:hypothetical protein n=1 Tax=Microbulbifer hainanensis TaxID=2735675 RepID=UPI001865B51C|nr:hypothetical protein [Microbulbifer hainanensis]